MIKRGRGEVAKKILDALSSNPYKNKTIQEVSKESNVNWETTKRYLELFVKLGIVRESPENNKMAYQKIRSLQNDTLFSIPLSDEQKETIKRIYATIEKVWKNSVKKTITKTIVQKIAVDVVEKKFSKSIPRAWYLYGQVLLLPYELDEEYTNPFNDEEMINLVTEVCCTYAAFDGTAKVRRYQYETKKNNLYLAKENVSYFLNCCDLNDNSIKNKMRKYLNEFAFSWERKECNADILAIMEDFCSTTLSILRNADNSMLNQARASIVSSFDAVWNLIGTYEFYDSLIPFYNKELLNDFLSEKVKVLKETALEALEELREHDKMEIPQDEIATRLHSLIGSAKCPETQKRDKEKAPESLFDEAGL